MESSKKAIKYSTFHHLQLAFDDIIISFCASCVHVCNELNMFCAADILVLKLGTPVLKDHRTLSSGMCQEGRQVTGHHHQKGVWPSSGIVLDLSGWMSHYISKSHAMAASAMLTAHFIVTVSMLWSHMRHSEAPSCTSLSPV